MGFKNLLMECVRGVKKLAEFDRLFSRQLSRLGHCVAGNPLQFIIHPILITIILGTGLQHFQYQSNPEYLFVPVGAPSSQEKALVEDLFPMNNSRFIRGAESGINKYADLILLPKHGDNVLTYQVLHEAFLLDTAIKKIQVSIDGEMFSWQDLCVKFDDACLENDFLEIRNLLNTSTLIKYPTMENPYKHNKHYPIVAHLGGNFKDEKVLKSAGALKLTYILDYRLEKQRRAGEIWALVAMEYAYGVDLKYTIPYAITEKSIEIELSENIDSMAIRIPVSVVLVVAFTIYNCMGTDWVRSKPLMGLVGLILTIMSSISSFGLLMYCGWPWQAINIVVILLLIGIGLDDTFVMLSAWWRTDKPGASLAHRIAETYADAAVSISITTSTNVISFAVGAFIPGFPCVQIFCTYAGVGLMFVYIYTITIFGGLLTYFGKWEMENRHCLFFVKVKSKTEAENKNLIYKSGVQGGVSKANPANPREFKDGKLSTLFRDVFAPLLNRTGVKICIIIIFLAYLAVSIYGILQLKEGLERKKLASDYSRLVPYFQVEDTFFRDHPYRFQFIINEEIDYFNQSVKDQLFDYVDQLERSPYISSDPDFRQFWLGKFLELSKENFHLLPTDTPEFFYQSVAKFMEGAKTTPIVNDVVFNQNKTGILASRFFLQSVRISDAIQEVNMLKSVRELAENAPFKVTVYHPYFGFFDQFSQVVRTTIDCTVGCLILMAIITLIFMPNRICVIWVTFTIISVEIGVVGLMALCNINLDVISMIMLIMSIGFSVDFSAHVSYHYLSAGSEDHGPCDKVWTPEERLAYSLHALGGPVLQGGMSTLLAVVGIMAHPSYISQAFSKLIFLIIILGVLHGLLLLPVLLTWFGPGGTFSKKKSTTPKVIRRSLSTSDLSNTFVYSPSKKSPIKKIDMENNLSASFSDICLSSDDEDKSNGEIKNGGTCNGSKNGEIAKGFQIDKFVKHAMRPRSYSVDGENSKKSEFKDPLPYYNFASVRRNQGNTMFLDTLHGTSAATFYDGLNLTERTSTAMRQTLKGHDHGMWMSLDQIEQIAKLRETKKKKKEPI